jgi:hypothetical protein
LIKPKDSNLLDWPLNPPIVRPQKGDPENSLYVIITDLYQEKAQWEDLVANLKDYYLLV